MKSPFEQIDEIDLDLTDCECENNQCVNCYGLLQQTKTLLHTCEWVLKIDGAYGKEKMIEQVIERCERILA